MTPARLKPNAIAPKIKEAVRHLLTQETFNFAEAARVAGTTTERLRDEMLRPHTRKYLREQRRAQIEAVIANNPTVLAAIRDRGKNEAARVRAAAVLEQSFIQANLETVGASQKLSPGLVIIVGGPNSNGVTVDQPRRLAGARSIHEPGALDREAVDAEIVDDDEPAARG